MGNKWKIDSNESDVLLKTKRSLIDYMPGTKNNFKGHVAIQNNEVENASIEFSLKANGKNNNSDLKLIDFFDYNEIPVIQFKSTSFEKINKNINFLKGHLTIKNITKVIELDTEFIGFKNDNGIRKASFEITGSINRKDFGLNCNPYYAHGSYAVGSDIQLIANLEFTHN
ncbi:MULTISPECIES: YceI family protein [Flavobacterium]|uniref:YceI family protein n=1 Tax=Flavobacterium TaxID=237 RepID=UPI00188B37D2|nr:MULTISPECIES: YceI family protein [Flavobacterium]MBF4473266.1 YceI family protein [Flavobacterium sp. HJJ]